MKLNKLVAAVLFTFWYSFSCFAQTSLTTYYKTYGKGQPLLIINGGPGMNSEGFETLANLLKDDFTIILYDQRGTGKTKLEEINETTITLDLMIEDLENLRKKLGFKQWHILGHSFGGMLASYYTSKYPSKVNSLVLSSSGGVNLNFMNYIHSSVQQNLTDEQRQKFNHYNALFQNGDTTFQTRYQRALNLAGAYLVNDGLSETIGYRLLQINYDVNQLVFDNMQKIKFDCRDGLKKYGGNVLVIQGKQDIIKEETAQESASSFSNAKVYIIDGCAHYCWLEKQVEYVSRIKEFLKS